MPTPKYGEARTTGAYDGTGKIGLIQPADVNIKVTDQSRLGIGPKAGKWNPVRRNW